MRRKHSKERRLWKKSCNKKVTKINPKQPFRIEKYEVRQNNEKKMSNFVVGQIYGTKSQNLEIKSSDFRIINQNYDRNSQGFGIKSKD